MKTPKMLLGALLPLALLACSAEEAPPPAETAETVSPALQQLAQRAEPGKLGVAWLPLGGADAQAHGINLDEPMPLQSVFKLPLAIFVLHKAEQGEIDLDQTITLTRNQLSVSHSPIADGFDEMQDYTVEELVRAAVATSDNTAADVLMKMTGGPEALTAFFKERGIEAFRVDRYEYELQPQAVGLPEFTGQWTGYDAFAAAQAEIPEESQKAAMTLYLADPRDRMSPRAAVKMLAMLESGRLLSPDMTELMMEILRSTSTGADRLKAGVPEGTTVYHKTGTGPTVAGVNAATNDIGIVQLADGSRIAIAVFLAGAELTPEGRAAIIAEAARIAVQENDGS